MTNLLNTPSTPQNAAVRNFSAGSVRHRIDHTQHTTYTTQWNRSMRRRPDTSKKRTPTIARQLVWSQLCVVHAQRKKKCPQPPTTCTTKRTHPCCRSCVCTCGTFWGFSSTAGHLHLVAAQPAQPLAQTRVKPQTGAAQRLCWQTSQHSVRQKTLATRPRMSPPLQQDDRRRDAAAAQSATQSGRPCLHTHTPCPSCVAAGVTRCVRRNRAATPDSRHQRVHTTSAPCRSDANLSSPRMLSDTGCKKV